MRPVDKRPDDKPGPVRLAWWRSRKQPDERRGADDRRVCFDRRDMIRFEPDRRSGFDRRADVDPWARLG